MNPADRPTASLPQQKNYEKNSTQPSAGAVEDIHTYPMRVSSTHALEIHSYIKLNQNDLWRVSQLFRDKLSLGERNITVPESMCKELGIKSISLVDIILPAKDSFKKPVDGLECSSLVDIILPAKDSFKKPVDGLECFSDLYRQIDKIDSEQEEVYKCVSGMYSGKPINLGAYNRPRVSLVAFAEYIKVLEESDDLSKNQIGTLKNWLVILKSIFDEEIPDTTVPLHAVAKGIGVSDELKNSRIGHFTWGGKLCYVAFIVSLIQFITEGLGIYEICSKEFSENIISCLSPVARNMVEIGAGRGMVSASLEACGKKVLYVSDLFPPKKTWKNIRVAKKSAEKVTENYCNEYMKVIYLSSQPDIGMICNLIKSGNPMLILQTGFTYPHQLSKYASTSKLRVIDLKIPGYSGHYTEDRVRLLACNVTEDDFWQVKSKVPEKYRVET